MSDTEIEIESELEKNTTLLDNVEHNTKVLIRDIIEVSGEITGSEIFEKLNEMLNNKIISNIKKVKESLTKILTDIKHKEEEELLNLETQKQKIINKYIKIHNI